jgi:hypothetical protein
MLINSINLTNEGLELVLDTFLLKINNIDVEEKDMEGVKIYRGFVEEVVNVIREEGKSNTNVLFDFIEKGFTVCAQFNDDKFFADLWNKYSKLVLELDYISARDIAGAMATGKIYPATANTILMRFAVSRLMTSLFYHAQESNSPTV